MKHFLITILLSSLLLLFVYKVQGATINACDTDKSADCIQLAVDKAKNGDTVVIAAGTYKGDYYSSFAEGQEASRVDKCFVNLKGKDITLTGTGAILFGEGHDRPYVEPLASRAGICSVGGKITIDGIRIKEFQKRCGIFINSQVVIKNSVIEGCDEGGISMIDGATGLFVNNYFVATGGLLLQGKPEVKVINNTFFSSNIQYFIQEQMQTVPKADIINNIIVNKEFTVGIVNGTPIQVGNLSTSRLSNNLIWKEDMPCYDGEICKDYTGKILADPLFIEPVIDQRGMAAWANFGFKEGSPAVGKGDPSIPGKKELGVSGGPCVTPNNATCTSYIRANGPPDPKPFQMEPPPVPGGKNGTGGNQKVINPFGIPIPLSNLINLPNNFSFDKEKDKSTKSVSTDGGINLMVFVLISATYIMFIYLAIGIKGEFNLFLTIAGFIFGGAVGGWIHSYEAGMVIGIVLSLLFF